MPTLPAAVSDYLLGLTQTTLRLAYLQVDRSLRLLAGGGDLPAYGVHLAGPDQVGGLARGEPVTESLPYLVGAMPSGSEAVVLPVVEIAPDQFANVHIFSHDGDFWILLLDASTEGAQRRLLQQRAHELDLLQGKNRKLIARLETANDALTALTQEVQAKNIALQEIAERREEFFHVALHDIRSPLASFQMLIGAMKDGLMGDLDAAQQRIMGRLGEAIKEQMNQVNGLLESAQCEAGELRLDLQPTDLSAMLREALDAQLPHAREKSIELDLSLEVPLPLVVMDKEKIRRIIANYLTNALKFTDRGGGVVLSARFLPAENLVRVSVSDTGVGIPAEDLPRLFQKYQRAKNKATDGEKSLGLGLYICRQIAEAHGGGVEARSEVGEGSVFSFTLPCRTPESSAAS